MSETVNRRDFLTASAAVAGTLMLSSKMYAAGSGSINIGIVGCGGRGSGALQNVLEADKEVKVAAICDLIEGRAKGTFKQLEKQARRSAARDRGHLLPRSGRLQEAARTAASELRDLRHAAGLPSLSPGSRGRGGKEHLHREAGRRRRRRHSKGPGSRRRRPKRRTSRSWPAPSADTRPATSR